MNTCLIKLTSPMGKEPKMFRAYGSRVTRNESLGISCTTTGEDSYAVIRCAAKVFKARTEPAGDLDEIQTRIRIETLRSPGLWRAHLQPAT